VWVDTAIAGSEQARAVAISRVVVAIPDRGPVQHLQAVPRSRGPGLARQRGYGRVRNDWARLLPEPILAAIRIKGHYYAAPVNIHMPTWIWYSKAAFRKAGLTAEPATIDELFADLDRLKSAASFRSPTAAALAGNILFRAMLANVAASSLSQDRARPRCARGPVG